MGERVLGTVRTELVRRGDGVEVVVGPASANRLSLPRSRASSQVMPCALWTVRA
jgi:hypothetical protein